MRWQRLFADLAAQATAEDDAELAAEVTDRSRIEAGRIDLVTRLHDATNQRVTVGLVSTTCIAGRVLAVGADWLLLEQDLEGRLGCAARELLVPMWAITAAGYQPGDPGLLSTTSTPSGTLLRSLRFGHALRSLARDRQGLLIELAAGSQVSQVGGTIDRVGADYLELAEHAGGELRRRDAIRSRQLVAFAAIALVRRIDDYKVSS